MTFTIEELEALKEGTTPGPWEFREHSSYEYPAGAEWGPMQTELEHAVLDKEDAHLFGAYNNYKMIEHPGNLPLAAASPALLDQLIAREAELQQLKAQIEELRDSYMEDSGTVGSPQEEQIELDTHGETAKTLTQILEGNA